MPPQPINRGEIWLVDLGMAAKVRPCLVISVPLAPADRVLFTLVPHTTSLHGTIYEIPSSVSFLKAGAFDAQGLVTVPRPRLIRRLGVLAPAELTQIENAVRTWLGL